MRLDPAFTCLWMRCANTGVLCLGACRVQLGEILPAGGPPAFFSKCVAGMSDNCERGCYISGPMDWLAVAPAITIVYYQRANLMQVASRAETKRAVQHLCSVSSQVPRAPAAQNNCLHFSICACHPCAGAMLIFSVSFQFYVMIPEGNPESMRA